VTILEWPTGLPTDAPVCKSLSDGTEYWVWNGMLHRTDGPAVTRPDGLRAWYAYGKRHRDDGPAVVKADGTEEFWQKGVQLSNEPLSTEA